MYTLLLALGFRVPSVLYFLAWFSVPLCLCAKCGVQVQNKPCGNSWCTFTRPISQSGETSTVCPLLIPCTPLTVTGLLVVTTALSVSALFPAACPHWANEAHHRRGQVATCNKLLCFDFSGAVAVWRSSIKTSLARYPCPQQAIINTSTRTSTNVNRVNYNNKAIFSLTEYEALLLLYSKSINIDLFFF